MQLCEIHGKAMQFTTCVVFSSVVRGSSQNLVPHMSEPIAHVGLVHTSLDFLDCVWEHFKCLITKQTNQALSQFNMLISTYSVTYVPLSQSTVVSVYHSNNWTLNNSIRKI